MNHRKEEHPFKKKCRYFAKGECNFSSEDCWYVHGEDGKDDTNTNQVEEDFECFVCKNLFPSKYDLMEHKKKHHLSKIPCIKFQKGICERSAEKCRYVHSYSHKYKQHKQSTQCISLTSAICVEQGFSSNPLKNGSRPRGTSQGTRNAQPEAGSHGTKNVPNNKLRNLTAVKRSNKPMEALDLPIIANINPRSVYNKVNEFNTFVEEEEVDVTFMSESWEREEKTHRDIIKLEHHEIISNVFQRKGKGGRLAIIEDRRKYIIQNLTNTLINIKWGVEAVWCLLTPKNANTNSKIQKIACASIYSKHNSKSKADLLDHIAEAYNILCTKYKKGLHFILAGDTNDLNLNAILHLSPNLSQIVATPTRTDPVTGVEAILDPVITTLTAYYQKPCCLAPLDPDPESNGKPSDHRIVVVRPISSINKNCARSTRNIKVRPLTEHGMNNIRTWLANQDWEDVFKSESPSQKAEIFQNMLVNSYKEFFPEKKFSFYIRY